MASKEFHRPDWPKPYTEKTSHKYRQVDSDPLFDRDWEIFVVRRDNETGEFRAHTACCEDALSNDR